MAEDQSTRLVGSPLAAGTPEQIENNEIERERLSILRMLRFCSKTDDLASLIISAIKPVLNRTMTEDRDIMITKDVESMLFCMPPIDDIIILGFFNRSALPFRFFRLMVTLHNVDPVSANILSMFDLTERESAEKHLYENTWNLLFCGAENAAIQGLLNSYRERKRFLNSSTHSKILNDPRNSCYSVSTPPSETPRTFLHENLLPNSPRAIAQALPSAVSREVQDFRANFQQELFPTNHCTPEYLAQPDHGVEESNRSQVQNYRGNGRG